MKNPSLGLKLAFVAGLGYYLYFLAKKNGGTFKDNPEGVKVMFDTDAALDFTLAGIVSPNTLPYVKRTTKNILNHWAKAYGIKQQKVL